MAQKIIFNTSSKIIRETFEEEFPRAAAWLNKSYRRVTEWRKPVLDAQDRMSKGYDMPITLKKTVEYVSAAGNRWLGMVTVIPAKYHERFGGDIVHSLVMYGMTVRYMWFILRMDDVSHIDYSIDKSKSRVFVFTPHFFQRLYERLQLNQHDRIALLRNLMELIIVTPIQERVKGLGKGKQQIYGKIPGCILFGSLDKHRVGRFFTVLPEKALFNDQLHKTRIIRNAPKMSVSDYYRQNTPNILSCENPMAYLRNDPVFCAFDRAERLVLRHYFGCMMMCINATSLLDRTHFRAQKSDEEIHQVLQDYTLAISLKHRSLRFHDFIPLIREALIWYYSDITEGDILWVVSELSKKASPDGKVNYDNFNCKGLVQFSNRSHLSYLLGNQKIKL